MGSTTIRLTNSTRTYDTLLGCICSRSTWNERLQIIAHQCSPWTCLFEKSHCLIFLRRALITFRGLQILERLVFNVFKKGFPQILRKVDGMSEPRFMRDKDEFKTRGGIQVTCLKPTSEYKIYRYRNSNATHKRTLIYYHGGGMVFGPAKGGYPIAVCRALGDAQIFAVDYRLSPDYPHPVPVNDCVAATRYLLENRKELEIGDFACYGESAGGHLTLSVNMVIDYMAEFGVEPSLISSIVPMAGLDFETNSYRDPKRQAEMAGFLVRKCWLAFAGLDMYDSRIMAAMSKNDHLGL